MSGSLRWSVTYTVDAKYSAVLLTVAAFSSGRTVKTMQETGMDDRMKES